MAKKDISVYTSPTHSMMDTSPIYSVIKKARTTIIDT